MIPYPRTEKICKDWWEIASESTSHRGWGRDAGRGRGDAAKGNVERQSEEDSRPVRRGQAGIPPLPSLDKSWPLSLYSSR